MTVDGVRLMAHEIILICGGMLLLLVGIGVLSFFANIIGMIFDLIGMVVSIGMMGPVPGCGCVVLVIGCGLVASIGYIWLTAMGTCNTEQAMNFCRLLGG